MRFAMLIVAALCLPVVAGAQERTGIGTGRIFNNDLFGDGHDRWRTGSYAFSHVRGPGPWLGAPGDFGEIIEYRLRAEIIAPTRGTRERPYVGAISAGAQTHFGQGPLSYSLGADLVALGPQTGLADFQRAYHRTFSLPRPPLGYQLDNDVAISGTASASYRYRIDDTLSLRPFVEAQAGVEDLVRVGGDLMFGPVAQDDLMLRDVVTGQLYRGTQTGPTGMTFVVGADYAQMGDSLFLPEDEGIIATDTRTRARAGVHWQPLPEVTFFYGVTWLSEEFEGQEESQLTGSLKLNFNF